MNNRTLNINSWLIALFISLTCIASMINSFISIPYISAILSFIIFCVGFFINKIRVSSSQFYAYIILLLILIFFNNIYDAVLLSSYLLYYITFATTSLVLSSIPYNAIKTFINLWYIYIIYLIVFLFRIQYSLMNSDEYGLDQMGVAYSFVPVVLISAANFIYKIVPIKSVKFFVINLVLLFGSLYIILYMTITRGAILSLLIGLIILIYYKSNKVQRRFILLIGSFSITSLVIFLDVFLNNLLNFSEGSGIGALTKLATFADEGDISNGRNRLYSAAITMFKNRPLLGNGVGYYEQVNDAYVHNIVLQILCEGGIIGSILFFIPIFRIRFIKYYHDINLAVLHIILLSSTLSLLMFSSTHWLVPTFWLIYFMLISNKNNYNNIY